jgi:hypothetical protein
MPVLQVCLDCLVEEDNLVCLEKKEKEAHPDFWVQQAHPEDLEIKEWLDLSVQLGHLENLPIGVTLAHQGRLENLVALECLEKEDREVHQVFKVSPDHKEELERLV